MLKAASACLLVELSNACSICSCIQGYKNLELGTSPHLPNVLTSEESPYWKAVRQTVAPCFSMTNMKAAFPVMQHLADKACTYISSAAPGTGKSATSLAQEDGAKGPAAAEVDVANISKRYTSDIIGHLLFNEDLGGMDMKPSPYLELIADMLKAVNKRQNPLYNLMFWSKEVQAGRAVLAKHDKLMGQKLAAVLKVQPPEYTIIGKKS